VLVAGASSGIGAATAIRAAATGAAVTLFARNTDRLAAIRDRIVADGGTADVISGDATDEAAAAAAVEQAVSRHGRLDVLVNSVGVNIPDRSLSALTRERWHHLLTTNVDSAYVLTQAVLPYFREQRDGLLVHISSVCAKRADMSGVGYQASKAAVAALAHATMEEERDNGVRVTVVYSGFANTPLVLQRPTPPKPEELTRALEPDDVARMCVAVMAMPARAHVPEVLVAPTRK
jgi:NADP-dependent 3-hydroxy acid dehydrogenase YdfG